MTKGRSLFSLRYGRPLGKARGGLALTECVSFPLLGVRVSISDQALFLLAVAQGWGTRGWGRASLALSPPAV